jgi:hypothetical protein
MDRAARDGVGERRIIRPGRVWTNIVQLDMFSSKSFGSFDPRSAEFTRAGELATSPVPGASCHFSAGRYVYGIPSLFRASHLERQAIAAIIYLG